MSKNLMRIILPLLAFVVSGFVSFGLTYYLYSDTTKPNTSPVITPPPGGQLSISPSAPKNSECPINGAMYTETEKNIWESRRPIVAMIENSIDARPHSGLSSADVIYEALAEGGVTRFAAVFYCGVSAKDTTIAPVRSARTTFVNLASEYNYPLYVHAGGANCSSADGGKTCTTDKRVMAIEQLDSYGWRGANDLDEFGVGIKAFKRDLARLWEITGKEVAWEHGLTASTEKLFKYAKDVRGWTNLDAKGREWSDKFVKWSFKSDAKEKGDITRISFGFWENFSQFNVVWNYDQATNSYIREQGGVVAKDLNNNQEITAKVVIVQFAKELGPLDEHKHVLHEVIGTGKALIFQDGNVVEAIWNKKDRESRTIFTDAKGKKIDFNRGLIFIEIVPLGNKVTY